MIKTVRMFLEPVTEAHAPKMLAGLRDERAYRFIGEEPPESLEQLAARYALLAGKISPNGKEVWLNWMLRRRGQDFYLGYVQATVILAEQAAMVAYHLFPAYWGNGFAREAEKSIIATIGPAYRLREVRAYIDARNARSIRLVEALNFKRDEHHVAEDTLPDHVGAEYLYVLPLEI